MAGKGKLAGKTVFITGASRGIGKAIALRCAQDGANIVIAAKTAEPHPKLPGTIYTAAKEIENAGGKCLPCIVDVRSEEQVQKAVDEAVQKFGGIDILVNNASAISTTGTESTNMKKYDLMNNVNTRGTFLCSKLCIPYLMKSKNPHILNISPPLSMRPRWFKDHVAYTIAKYGMSLCALGMAEELKDDGIACNTLWPRTLIYTAATEMLGGEAIKRACRSPDIMSDAAYIMFTKDSRQYTGNFVVDEDFLIEEGITDEELLKYQYDPNVTPSPDFFVGLNDPDGPVKTGNPALDKIFHKIQTSLDRELMQSIKAVVQLHITDNELYYLNLKTGMGGVYKGISPIPVDVKITIGTDDFLAVTTNSLDAMKAVTSGKMKVQGNFGTVQNLDILFKRLGSSSKL